MNTGQVSSYFEMSRTVYLHGYTAYTACNNITYERILLAAEITTLETSLQTVNNNCLESLLINVEFVHNATTAVIR